MARSIALRIRSFEGSSGRVGFVLGMRSYSSLCPGLGAGRLLVSRPLGLYGPAKLGLYGLSGQAVRAGPNRLGACGGRLDASSSRLGGILRAPASFTIVARRGSRFERSRRLISVNSAGNTRGSSPYTFALHISGEFPNGEGTGPPYESEIPGWSTKLSEAESAQTLKEYEAKHANELEAQHAKEHQEQEFREAVTRAAEAAARKEREEEADVVGGVSLRASRVMVERGKTALVKLEYLGIAACKGKLTLTATGAAARKSKRKNVHPRAIGTASFSIEGDEVKTIDMALNQAGRALIGSARGSVSARLEFQDLASAAGSKQRVRVRLIKKRA
jgi:hypothetical protein